MDRALSEAIRKDLSERIVLISGPRQSGKTTLARSLEPSHDYFNYDRAEDRLRLQQKSWDRDRKLVIFDELHKMRGWKSWLKGIYDTEGNQPQLLVTGSARLDTHRKVGDSLAGRYFRYRLHPFDLAEVAHEVEPERALKQILSFSGFPEPFLRDDARFYKRWRQTHLDIILRQDLIELETVRDVQAIETLVELLKHRVGSPVSYASLARDLERDAKTVRRWLSLLENLYVIFRVAPYSKRIPRSLLKEPKYYFFDTAAVLVGDGGKLENLVACALLKELHRIEDMEGDRTELCYLRTKEGREVDFVTVIERTPTSMIEVKWSDAEPSPSLARLAAFLPQTRRVQLVANLAGGDRTYPDGAQVRRAAPWLARISESLGVAGT
jgi:hypothetical protein